MFWIGLGSALLFANTLRAGAPLTAEQVMEKDYVVSRFAQSHEISTMELISANGDKRVRKLKSISRLKPGGDDRKRIIEFESPADIKGTAILIDEDLSSGDKVWVYLPALKKNRRLPGSGKRESFAGSDFTYGDIVRPRVKEFKHTLLGEEPCPTGQGARCYVIESVPANPDVLQERGVSYKKSWVRTDNFVLVKFETKDEAGRPWKAFEGRSAKLIDSKRSQWLTMENEIEDQQTHRRSRIVFESVDTGRAVPESALSPNYLDRGLQF